MRPMGCYRNIYKINEIGSFVNAGTPDGAPRQPYEVRRGAYSAPERPVGAPGRPFGTPKKEPSTASGREWGVQKSGPEK